MVSFSFLYFDSTHTKLVDAIIGNGHIFSSFTGEYHNIKNLRPLDGDNHVNLFFDDSQQEVAEIEIMIAGIIYSDFFDLRSPPGL